MTITLYLCLHILAGVVYMLCRSYVRSGRRHFCSRVSGHHAEVFEQGFLLCYWTRLAA